MTYRLAGVTVKGLWTCHSDRCSFGVPKVPDLKHNMKKIELEATNNYCEVIKNNKQTGTIS